MLPTTEWSLVIAAAKHDTRAGEALARLCAMYWYPVFAFVRRRGHSPEDAQDLTQGFFTRLIEKADLGDADRTRGRFRSFLLTACQHYLANEHDRAHAQKRGGANVLLPIDVAAAEDRYARALSHDETPERVYDRHWCLTLLGSVLDDLRDDYAASGNERLFDRLRAFLTGDDESTYTEAAIDLGMTAGAVKVAVHRLRRRYRDALRARVAGTVATDTEIEDEIRHLLEVL
jgi:RNA polymerase sigma factor (sigma-70 family)